MPTPLGEGAPADGLSPGSADRHSIGSGTSPGLLSLVLARTELVTMSGNTTDGTTRTPTRDLFSLAGRIAIVTGATGGIGLVVATALAESGASIVSIQIPNDPNSQTLRQAVEGAGQTFKSFDCNLLDAPSIKECFERIWAAGVVPDILFHAAGITHRSMIVDTTVETLNRVRL